jgi:DNA-binding NarL/FixJ family response regulator
LSETINKMSTKHKIAIIEDDSEAQKILESRINLMEDFECSLVCKSVQELMHYKASQFDYLILDLGLPNVEKGMDALVFLKEKLPNLEIIILTSYEADDLIVKALTLGASGYLFKSEVMSNLEEELKVILNGGAALSPLVARKIIGHFNPKSKAYKSMSPKEHQILKLLANGSTYEEIAEALNMKIDNVRYYIKSIYKKLHVSNRSAAIQKYFFNFFK